MILIYKYINKKNCCCKNYSESIPYKIKSKTKINVL